MRLTSRWQLLLALGVTLAACSGGGLSGASRSVGGKSKASDSSGSLGNEAQGTEVGNGNKAKTESSTSGQGAGGDASDEDMKVIPPETVSGAYLTCEVRRPEPGNQTSGDYGCSAFTKSGARLSLAGTGSGWSLKNADGSAVAAEPRSIEGTDYDRLWHLTKHFELSKLRPEATVSGQTLTRTAPVCSVAQGGLIVKEFRSCVAITIATCGCDTASVSATDFGPGTEYSVLAYEMDQATGLCGGQPVEQPLQNVSHQGLVKSLLTGGAVTGNFSLPPFAGMCVQLKAKRLGVSVFGGLLD